MGRATEEIEKQVIKNYLDKNMGLQTAGKKFGLSQYMVEKILKKYGVKKRTYIEAKQTQRIYFCDDHFFKTQSPDMAYILGLIAADGSVSKKENCVAIQLLASDREILDKISLVTKNTRPIDEYIRKETNHKIATFRVWSKEWKNDLTHYGIIPQKTFTLQPPVFLDPKYRIDYIRGYFDGDGSIYALKNKALFEIVGASKAEINWIQDELLNHYHVVLNKPLHETLPTGTIMYKIKSTNKEELMKLYHLFYDNKSLFLSHKKEKFKLLLNIPRDFNSSDEE